MGRGTDGKIGFGGNERVADIGTVRLEAEAIKRASGEPETFAIYKPSLL